MSRTVKDLVAGSGLEFIERGDHDLKGAGTVAAVLGGWGEHPRLRAPQGPATSSSRTRRGTEHLGSRRFRAPVCAHYRAAQAVACGQLMRLIQHLRDTDCR